ncbi:probable pathogenesis-related protein ARB_02861 [Diospyros lotus]|uniref:probable pathogenesis-related protein ARB_02861 n=1 Tax=Diospyros lotus TaxID=55363 RepID=UPI00224D4FC5|nr:probable pathogenesis-related protein ARB_02861 [Diospyros lotus]
MAAEFIAPLKMLLFVYVIAVIVAPTSGFVPRKLDDVTPPDSGVKCSGCSPCNKPCTQYPPPPPPVLPPPPPKKPPSQNCPPPPSPPSAYLYITGPPGNLYPIDQYYSGIGRSSAGGVVVLIGWGLVGLLAFW